MDDYEQLSRRERQIMDAIFSLGEATANQVLEGLSDPPTKTAVRTLLRILVRKGFLTTRKVRREMVYAPQRDREEAGQSALKRVLETFFSGSLEHAIAAHLAAEPADLPDEELKKLAALIREARKKGQ